MILPTIDQGEELFDMVMLRRRERVEVVEEDSTDGDDCVEFGVRRR